MRQREVLPVCPKIERIPWPIIDYAKIIESLPIELRGDYIKYLNKRRLKGDLEIGKIVPINYEFADGGTAYKVVFVDKHGNRFEAAGFTDSGGHADDVEDADLCISTQSGCTRGCQFCAVGEHMKMLTPEEMIMQIEHTVGVVNPDRNYKNVLGFMGNGEPVDNYWSVITAIYYLAYQRELSIDHGTISTTGVNHKGIEALAKALAKLKEDRGITMKLQYSLHFPDDVVRNKVMGLPAGNSLQKALYYFDMFAILTGTDVKYNVVLMTRDDGLTNCTPDFARRIVALLTQQNLFDPSFPINRIVKLSAYNPTRDGIFIAPPQGKRDEFTLIISQGGLVIKTFLGSGIDVFFACGQLADDAS